MAVTAWTLADVPTVPGRAPLVGHALAMWRDPLRVLCSLGAAGPVVRVDLGTRPAYFLTEPGDVHDLLVTHGDSLDRGRLFERARDFVGNGLATSDGDLHRRMRALMQPAFGHARLTGYTEIMADTALRTASSWRHGATIAFDREMYALTVTTISRAMFSSTATAEVVAEVQELLPLVADGLFARTLLPKPLTRVPLPANRRFDAAVARLRELVRVVIADHEAAGADRNDLLSILLASAEPLAPDGMSRTQLRDEVITIMTTGTETTALTLAWAFHELARWPDVAARVYAEVDAVIGERPVCRDDVDRLPYTNRFLNEVMRLHAIPVIMRRATAPLHFAGLTFPKNTDLCYSPYAVHRDARLFPRPEHLDPDRWTGEAAARLPRGAFTPFGAGRRKCIGHSFAWAELVIAVAAIAARWRLEPVGPAPREVMSASIPRPHALPMKLVARQITAR